MSTISKFMDSSPIHKVISERSGFSIYPVDSSDIAAENFQVIAREAAQYRGTDFIAKPHPEKPPFDMVTFLRDNER